MKSVLNLVINGIPSILRDTINPLLTSGCFKPCYKWNTFNTRVVIRSKGFGSEVLNLVINGIPSIHY